MGIQDWGLVLGIGIEIGIEIGIQVYLIGSWDAGLIRNYSQLNITLFLDYFSTDKQILF